MSAWIHWTRQITCPSPTPRKLGKHSFTLWPPKRQPEVMSSTKDLNSMINDIQGMTCGKPNQSHLRDNQFYFLHLQFHQLVLFIGKRNIVMN